MNKYNTATKGGGGMAENLHFAKKKGVKKALAPPFLKGKTAAPFGGMSKFALDKFREIRYPKSTIETKFLKKAIKRRVSSRIRHREPRLVQRGTEDAGEHGLGAARPSG